MNWEQRYMQARRRLHEAMQNQIPVRCKDCKYGSPLPGEPRILCHFVQGYYSSMPIFVKLDGFCSWGEKK